MGFSAKQLKRCGVTSIPICPHAIESNGRELSYIEGWYAISEANRIFGFDAWSRETVETRCVLAEKTVAHSSRSIRRRCALQLKQTG